MNKQEAGRKGGQTTAATHGSDHMATIGRKGAAEFWRRYRMVPHGTNAFAIVNRETGAVVAYTTAKR